MERNNLISAFSQLGKIMVSLGKNDPWSGLQLGLTEQEYEKLNGLISRQVSFNGWFTEKNVRQSLLAIGSQLDEGQLNGWLAAYSWSTTPKVVLIIMAGNIPVVGFHDLLCVLMSGNNAICKLSSDDKTLLPALMEAAFNLEPALEQRVSFAEQKISGFDAVIATGSDNSSSYFQQYFGTYPHIFRRNRTSTAIISGNENEEDFVNLGHDIFDYYGLGCRNVSHLLVPKEYDFQAFFKGIVVHGDVINHFKYGNNYDYNKTVYLMNQHALLDNNFVLLYESKALFSPLAMIYFHYYDSKNDVENYLEEHKNTLQAVIGEGYIPFGSAQCPRLDDYADGVDVMKWLERI